MATRSSTVAARKDAEGSVRDILSALEYETNKEDRALTRRLLSELGLERATPDALARAVVAGPGLEALVLALLAEMRPFAAMMREIYSFFSANQMTVGAGARQLRVSRAGAEARLDLDLSGFPRELEAVLSPVALEVNLVRPFEGAGDDESERVDQVLEAWRRIVPALDEDFYGPPFWRARSYAHAKRPSLDEVSWARLEARIAPLLDRLAALVDLLDLGEEGFTRLQGDRRMSYGLGQSPIRAVHAEAHRIPEDDARRFLRQMSRPSPWSDRPSLEGDLQAIGFALSVWASRTVREDRPRFYGEPEEYGAPLSELQGDRYVDALLTQAERLEGALEIVAPDRRAAGDARLRRAAGRAASPALLARAPLRLRALVPRVDDGRGVALLRPGAPRPRAARGRRLRAHPPRPPRAGARSAAALRSGRAGAVGAAAHLRPDERARALPRPADRAARDRAPGPAGAGVQGSAGDAGLRARVHRRALRRRHRRRRALVPQLRAL